MQILKENLAAAAASYLDTDPGGVDVTASILSDVGRAVMEQKAELTHRTLDQANEDLGKMISEEVLPSLFFDVKVLESVKVDPKRWPTLAGWVTTYTQHRVGRRRR
jgi:hypothetical protein